MPQPSAGTSPLVVVPRELWGINGWTLRYERWNGVVGCSLLVRRKPGLGEIMLEVFNASKGHDALALCSTPAEGFLGFI